MWLFLLFVGIPILEIALFIQVGGWLGLWPTLLVVICTAIAGSVLLRRQGMKALGKLQENLAANQSPAEPIAHGALILIAGVLLLTPGFFTDSVGIALLIPPVRRWLIAQGASRMTVRSTSFTSTGPSSRQHQGDDPIETDYEIIDETRKSGPGKSGWTRPD